MLEEFIRDRRALILQRTREKVASRSTPRATEYELEEGVPLFLDQLSARLREGVGNSSWTAMEQSASLRGAALWKLGLTIGQVVHDYGNICQAITELAVDLHASIPTEDFQMLNLVLDIAIAEAVTEYSRRNEQQIAGQNVENLGMLAHELRNYLNSATLAYEAVRSGSVGASGSTGAILGRSLTGMRELVTRTLADVRLEAGSSRVERIHVAVILEEIEIAAMTPTANRGVAISLEPVDPEVVVDADYQILTSVLTNLVQNAQVHPSERPCHGADTGDGRSGGDRGRRRVRRPAAGQGRRAVSALPAARQRPQRARAGALDLCEGRSGARRLAGGSRSAWHRLRVHARPPASVGRVGSRRARRESRRESDLKRRG